jgi:hypothetical protein
VRQALDVQVKIKPQIKHQPVAGASGEVAAVKRGDRQQQVNREHRDRRGV